MGRLAQLKDDLKNKRISHTEYYQDLFKKIGERNPKINAYIENFEDDCLAKAKELDSSPASEKSLSGLPIGIKEIISIKGKELTAASNILKGYRPPRSSTVVERLENDGALFVGRCNCDEFAMGSSNENSAFGSVKNPIQLDRTAGGSSGGSAAVVRAELAVGSLGTDTGGSIRLPASFCGITGLRPTYGRVSRSGVIAFASSLDQVGPMADDAEDCALILQSIAGEDPRDATSMPVPVPNYLEEMNKFSWKGKTVGLPKEFFETEGIQKEVRTATDHIVETLKREGAEFKEVQLPHSPLGIAVYYIVATAEASSNLARYDGIRYGHRAKNFESLKDLIAQSRAEGFGEEVKRRIMLGTFCLSSGYFDAYYSKAQFVRSKLQLEFMECFKTCDFVLAPNSPTTAFKLGEKTDDPLQMYLNDIFTVPVNLAGLPGISFPVANDSLGLPIGAQLISGPFQEQKLLGAVQAFEKLSPYSRGGLQC